MKHLEPSSLGPSSLEASCLEPSSLAILVLRIRIKYVSIGIFCILYKLRFTIDERAHFKSLPQDIVLKVFILFLKQESGLEPFSSKVLLLVFKIV